MYIYTYILLFHTYFDRIYPLRESRLASDIKEEKHVKSVSASSIGLPWPLHPAGTPIVFPYPYPHPIISLSYPYPIPILLYPYTIFLSLS